MITTNQENGNETCKISCRKRVASPGSMHDAGCLGLVHWDLISIKNSINGVLLAKLAETDEVTENKYICIDSNVLEILSRLS